MRKCYSMNIPEQFFFFLEFLLIVFVPCAETIVHFIVLNVFVHISVCISKGRLLENSWVEE